MLWSAAVPPPVDLLVVAAHTPDLRGLRDLLGDRLTGHVAGLNITAKTVGLGLAASGGGTARRIAALSPRAVVLLGTAGVYPGPPGYQPEDVVVAETLQLVSVAALDGTAAFPDPLQTSCETSSAISHGVAAGGGRVHLAAVANTLAQTIDDALAGRIHRATGAHAESLEAFGVAQACRLAELPFTAVLGIAHQVGSNAKQDFPRFQPGAAIAAAAALAAWLHRGAPGIPHGR
ncbi:MAG: hypothetical protein GXP55_13660 [Deltaproteobacteria bacterium]|nr:hypothetical protein [Deltaproteobacteria bacterium]